MVVVRRDASVSLRRLDGDVLYLPSYPVRFQDGQPQPVEHAGRLYLFLRVTPGRDYGGTEQAVYVFSER